jgi:hypothetical protein
VTYEDGSRILVLDVTADFAPNDRVTVSGAGFADLSAPASGRLELEVDAAGTLAAMDDKTITVFGPTGAGPSLAGIELALGPAAPNPFRGATRIRYDLPAFGAARLSVHDVTGRRVRVLEDSFREAGGHAAVWDGRDATGRRAAAGVYFVRLQAAGGELTRKIVLLR